VVKYKEKTIGIKNNKKKFFSMEKPEALLIRSFLDVMV
jgi:hypothetical protein